MLHRCVGALHLYVCASQVTIHICHLQVLTSRYYHLSLPNKDIHDAFYARVGPLSSAGADLMYKRSSRIYGLEVLEAGNIKATIRVNTTLGRDIHASMTYERNVFLFLPTKSVVPGFCS